MAGAALWLAFVRAPGPGAIAPEVLAVASAAGCDPLERPVVADPSRVHLAPGDVLPSEDLPAAAGPHDPSPLPPDPHVHEEPVSEARAVHNLEHAYVVVWYRPTQEGGPPAEVVAALADLVRSQDRMLLAPYPNLPEGRGVALLAWNTRWMCPAGVTPDQAGTLAAAFVDAYRGTTNAPEAPRGFLGRLFVA